MAFTTRIHSFRIYADRLVIALIALAFALSGSVYAQDAVQEAQDAANAAQEAAQVAAAARDAAGEDAAVTSDEASQDQVDDSERQELIEKLERYLSGVKFIGLFTVTGMEDKDPTPEEYTIKKAEKTPDGDYWLLTVRIKYGDNDVEMVLPPIEIKWAEGTPVITVDQLTIPGMGTFDARVLIRKNKYAGTWTHNDVGGHLFGAIERIEDGDEVAANESDADETDTNNTDTNNTDMKQGEEPAIEGNGAAVMEEPKAISIQHILIGFAGSVPGKGITRSKEEAVELVAKIRERIDAGEDFDALVKELTDDSHPGIYHMANTGERGDRSSPDQSEWVFERAGMVPGFGDVGFVLGVGEVGVAEHDERKSPYGWHIIKRLK